MKSALVTTRSLAFRQYWSYLLEYTCDCDPQSCLLELYLCFHWAVCYCRIYLHHCCWKRGSL